MNKTPIPETADWYARWCAQLGREPMLVEQEALAREIDAIDVAMGFGPGEVRLSTFLDTIVPMGEEVRARVLPYINVSFDRIYGLIHIVHATSPDDFPFALGAYLGREKNENLGPGFVDVLRELQGRELIDFVIETAGHDDGWSYQYRQATRELNADQRYRFHRIADRYDTHTVNHLWLRFLYVDWGEIDYEESLTRLEAVDDLVRRWPVDRAIAFYYVLHRNRRDPAEIANEVAELSAAQIKAYEAAALSIPETRKAFVEVIQSIEESQLSSFVRGIGGMKPNGFKKFAAFTAELDDESKIDHLGGILRHFPVEEWEDLVEKTSSLSRDGLFSLATYLSGNLYVVLDDTERKARVKTLLAQPDARVLAQQWFLKLNGPEFYQILSEIDGWSAEAKQLYLYGASVFANHKRQQLLAEIDSDDPEVIGAYMQAAQQMWHDCQRSGDDSFDLRRMELLGAAEDLDRAEVPEFLNVARFLPEDRVDDFRELINGVDVEHWSKLGQIVRELPKEEQETAKQSLLTKGAVLLSYVSSPKSLTLSDEQRAEALVTATAFDGDFEQATFIDRTAGLSHEQQLALRDDMLRVESFTGRMFLLDSMGDATPEERDEWIREHDGFDAYYEGYDPLVAGIPDVLHNAIRDRFVDYGARMMARRRELPSVSAEPAGLEMALGLGSPQPDASVTN